MWSGKLLFVTVVYWISYTRADSECPEFDCREPDCWSSSAPHETYLYLEDGTQCPGCRTCVINDPLDPDSECPPMACPMWRLPPSCKPEFYSLFLEYNGKECRACDTYICTGN